MRAHAMEEADGGGLWWRPLVEADRCMSGKRPKVLS